MAYWLVKSEPTVYSWQQFVKEGETQWTGVRNYAARLHLRAMKKGDQVLFYHSNVGLEIVGIGKISKEAYADPTAEDDTWSCVNLKPFKALKKPVTLAKMKEEKDLKNMPLIRIGRLSVMPITDEEFKKVMDMSV